MKHFSTIAIALGVLLILAGGIIVGLTYYQLIGDEVSYFFAKPNPNATVALKKTTQNSDVIIPLHSKFGIVIPKIRANSRIVPNVDPYNASSYQVALTKGVAQAAGSALPYEKGDMFLFSHSSVNFYEAVRYNSIFYLLDKLTKGDKIYVFYKGIKYNYIVTEEKKVAPTDVSYLSKKSSEHTLTLMTCWPPGTTWERLLIFAQQTGTSVK